MTGKILFLSAMCLSAISVRAQQAETASGNMVKLPDFSSENYLKRLTPTYLNDVSEASVWGSNWFFEIKGGASAFLGTPLGCGDLLDRISPDLHVGLGKWFTPSIGGRIAYQGLSLKNAEFSTMNYHFIHADFMYNITSGINCNDLGLARWDVIPYLGVGMAYNPDWKSACMCPGHASGSHPFAFSYGVECRYRITNRMHLVTELSGMTSARNFDGAGSSAKFGDNILALSAGMSFSFGKNGYRRIVDASPYMEQNSRLLAYTDMLKDQIRQYELQKKEDERIKAEYRKILEIEGLLELYQDHVGTDGNEKQYKLFPQSDYSGLNSLRERLSKKWRDDKSDSWADALKRRSTSENKNVNEEDGSMNYDSLDDLYDAYLMAMKECKEPIGAPVYFFFNIRTDNFTDESQLLNIDELAKVAKKYSLKVKIVGAADSATGNDTINDMLSRKRAKYVEQLMLDRGISAENIITSHEGGIDEYSPVQANRNTCVFLSF